MAAVTTAQLRPGLARAFWLAARPRTLPLAAAPVVVGTAVANGIGAARAWPALAALGCALSLQIAANFANDAFDAERGADGADRLGPPRAAALGWLTPAALKRATFAALAVAGVLGAGLALVAGWPVLALGALCALAALAYTGGPWPFGYHGLGEVAVFAFFGVVAVAGTVWVQTLALPAEAFAASLSVGALATAVLAVNNLRDRASDARAGKRTLAVRIGDAATRRLYAALLGAALLAPLASAIAFARPLLLASLLAAPSALRLARRVLAAGAGAEGAALNALLARTAQLGLAHALACALGWGAAA
ncbi:MAG TPA: 1,4-dihydroxy-2-naphthoate polyprenyltransferase [Myxococcota bacterium]|nr:1,4-dihydroxy-2-naphthoate polyprenyltransferase [Myxococcota bacterium]